MNRLRKRELLLSLKYATIEASFSVPMLNLTTSNLPFAIGFAVKVLGWNSAAVGLMAATPHLCNFLQPPITYFLQRFLSLYQIMVVGFIANALPWAFVMLFPWLGADAGLAFAAIVLVATTANSVCGVAWAASMSELVPLNIRGRYFGKRNLIFGFWTLVVVLAAGQLVDFTNNSIRVFGAIFMAAALARLIGLFFLTRMKFPVTVLQPQQQRARFADYLSVFRDRNYRWLLLFIGLWGFCLNLGSPFYTVYVLRRLPFTVGDLTVLTTLSGFGGLLSLRTWGALSDRFGNKPVLITCALLWSASAMLLWLFAGPQRYLHLYLLYFLTGFMTAGFQLCQFNLMIKLVPTESKAHYISVFFAFTSLLTAFGPIIGGKILSAMPDQFGVLLGQPLLKFHVVFVTSLFFCLISVNVLQLLREPAERPWRELVRVMGNMREFNPLLGLASLAQYMFTPRGLSRLARGSVRTLRRQTSAVSDVGEELVDEGWRVLKQPFEKDPEK
jgi:hypothetical protein